MECRELELETARSALIIYLYVRNRLAFAEYFIPLKHNILLP